MNHDNLDVVDDVMVIESGFSGVGVAGSPDPGPEGARSCSDGETTPVLGIKRKGTISGLAYIKSSVKTAMNEARLGGNKSASNRLIELLEDIYDTVTPMLTKRGKLRSPPLPPTKKLRDEPVTGPLDMGFIRPEMVDVRTDTVLTPNWWESEQERRKKESSRRRAAKAGARGPSAVENNGNTGAESAMETDGEG